MFISYLDSSGRPAYSERENYVLASITINEHSWHSIKKKINSIKLCHFPELKLDQIEFHAKYMTNRAEIYKKLSWKEIYAILDDLFGMIGDVDTHLVVIAALIQKSKLKDVIDVEEWAHRFVFERLNNYLEETNRNSTKAERYHEYGIMIIS